MSTKQILVVDDEPDIGEAAVYLLRRAGYAAQYAPNGELALHKLRQSPAALVLTDYMMPVMDGFQLLRALREREEMARVPVVMVSALPEEVVLSRGEKVDAFLRKPFRAAQLLESVRTLLGPPAQGRSSQPL
jgi:DNA-binding response OmpR family regulator